MRASGLLPHKTTKDIHRNENTHFFQNEKTHENLSYLVLCGIMIIAYYIYKVKININGTIPHPPVKSENTANVSYMLTFL